MHNHCQHNLYICHCTPSSSDPSPIHPPSITPLITTTSGELITTSTAPISVTQHNSVAVMTSPSLNLHQKLVNSASLTSLVASSDGPSSATTALSGFASCNTIPRVLVNTNGRMATVSAEPGYFNERPGRLTLVSQRSRQNTGLEASNMTVAR
jgi:hypothetical protein